MQQPSSRNQQALTFPILPFKDIVDLLHNALSLDFSLQQVQSPTFVIVSRTYSTLLDLLTGASREEVGRLVNSTLESSFEFPELYRDALAQLTLFREMDSLCKAARFEDFHIEDLTAPTGLRFQKILSAILNFGRFREDVLRQHAESNDQLAKQEEELDMLLAQESQAKAGLQQIRDQLQREAPEKDLLLKQRLDLQNTLTDLHAEISSYSKRIQEDKKRVQELQQRYASSQFDFRKLEAEVEDIASQLVSSPERVQTQHVHRKRKLEDAKVALATLQSERARLAQQVDGQQKMTAQLKTTLNRVGKVEEQRTLAVQLEAQLKSQRESIETFGFRLRELDNLEHDGSKKVQLAQERFNRAHTQRTQRVQEAQLELRNLQVLRESRKHNTNASEAKQMGLRLKAQEIRSKIDACKQEHAFRVSRVNVLLNEVVQAFDQFTLGVQQGVEDVEKSLLC